MSEGYQHFPNEVIEVRRRTRQADNAKRGKAAKHCVPANRRQALARVAQQMSIQGTTMESKIGTWSARGMRATSCPMDPALKVEAILAMCDARDWIATSLTDLQYRDNGIRL